MFHQTFHDCSSVAVLLCSFVGDFIGSVCFVIVCSSSLLPLVLRDDSASCLWHFLRESSSIRKNSSAREPSGARKIILFISFYTKNY